MRDIVQGIRNAASMLSLYVTNACGIATAQSIIQNPPRSLEGISDVVQGIGVAVWYALVAYHERP